MSRKRASRLALAWVRRLIAYGLLALLLAALLWPRSLEPVATTLPKLQFGQLLAALTSGLAWVPLGPLLLTILLTWLLGRWFCGLICPLGALMDLASRLRGLFSKQRFAPQPSRPRWLLVPGATLILFWLGITVPYGLLEPYSLTVSESSLYDGPSLVFCAVILLAIWKGRVFCDLLCPTGLILRFLAQGSRWGLEFHNRCLGCGSCSRVCRVNCVDGLAQTLDQSRCVRCLDCWAVCPNGSLQWGAIKPREAQGRRFFLQRAALGALGVGAGLTPVNLRATILGEPQTEPVLPPGALSLARLNAHCSLCHSCVRVCPNDALIPSPSPHPALWQRPVLDAYEGFCQYDCVLCGQVCPTGALIKLTVERKRVARLGVVVFNKLECVIFRNHTSCGACAELCPTGAVSMAPQPSGPDAPVINDKLCVGCGACQKVCPVRPISAILVRGLLIQQTAEKPVKVVTEDATLEEAFPF